MAAGNTSPAHDEHRERDSISSSTATTDEARARHAMLVAMTIAKRSPGGIIAYVVLALIVAASTRFDRTHATWTMLLVGGTIVLGVPRLAIAMLRERWSAASPRSFQVALRAGALAAALSWGVSAALAIGDVLDADDVVVFVTTAGIAAGAMSALAPDPWLTRGYLVCLLGPVVIASIHAGGQGLGVSITIAMFITYLLVQARHQLREFNDAIARTDQLAARAKALDEARAQAQAARQIADRANRAKSDFLASMSHEIRTPMTAILGYAELLLVPDASADDRILYAETIRRSGEHLLRLLNDVLDLAKIEAGKMTVTIEPCSAAEVLADVDSLMRARAKGRGLDFSVKLETPVPRTFDVDGTRLKQVILNLVGNAIKFTETGSVAVRARYSPSNRRFEVEVKDTGIGMTETQVAALFAPFAQVESSGSRFEGTGLGLDLSRRFARMMGGDVRVQSERGRGSTFVLDLPIANPDSEMSNSINCLGPAAAQTPTADLGVRLLGGVRVLLAEDGPENQRLIAAVLRHAGATVDIVGDGLEAVSRVLSARGKGAAYDVLLTDMEMPRLDGFGAVARLRSSGYKGPIVALTAHAMTGDRERCLMAGCDEHLTKPINLAVMIATIARFAGRSTNEKETGEAPLLTTLKDPDLVSLVSDFCDDLVGRCDELTVALGRGDRESLARIAHDLAGAGGSYGFDVITVCARRLELATHESGPLQRPVEELIRLCKRAIAGVERHHAAVA